jgi:60 kDa SS-A/Ro ribonucleoprotein
MSYRKLYSPHDEVKKATENLFTVIPNRESEMMKNSSGAYVFTLDKWAQFERFLILGTTGNHYYVSEKQLTTVAAKSVIECINENPQKAVELVVTVSESGRALKNDPALFALALMISSENPHARQLVKNALPKVARTGTHILHFVDYADGMRGWGKTLKDTVANWYTSKNVDDLAYQVIKYQSRDGWSQRDVLRKAHPKSKENNSVFNWITNNKTDNVPVIVEAFENAKKASTVKEIVDLISNHNLPREAIPTVWLQKSEVWNALMQKMPLTALIRNLGKLSSVGLLDLGSVGQKKVIDVLTNNDYLKKSRIHPISVLIALNTYKNGHGLKGSNTWTVNTKIIDALDDAFYGSFNNVEPTNSNIMMALDVSGSMSMSYAMSIPMSPREITAAMALVIAKTEKNTEFYGFCNTFKPLNISPKQRLDDVIKTVSSLPFGRTDCSLPFTWALENKRNFDSFQVWTDNETNSGVKPHTVLNKYRNEINKEAKLIVCATTANDFTIADPTDSGSLDIVGFDANVPVIINNFIKK